MSVMPDSPTSCSSSESSSGAIDQLKVGYLSKYTRGKWNKQRKWRQRWFLLDKGALSYYKSAPSKKRKKKTPPRELLLLGPSAVLEIPPKLPRMTPSPFCFTVISGSNRLLLCASTQDDFRSWTTAISAVINPNIPPVILEPTQSQELLDFPLTPTNSFQTYDPWSLFDTPMFGVGICFIVNPFTVINLEILAALISVGTTYCIWYIWSHGKTPKYLPTIHPKFSSSPEPVAEPLPKMSETTDSSDEEITECIPLGAVGYVDDARAFAGCSLNATSIDDSETTTESWSTLDAKRFRVRRGPNYKRNKTKAPSGPALLDLVATDVFQSDRKIDNIGSKIQLPRGADGRTDLIVINCQVPCYAPPNPLWGEQKTDGVGFNFVSYFSIPKDVREQLDAPGDPEAPQIKLLKWFMEEESEVRDRLKAIVVVVNTADQKLGRMERHLLETYNGQPILTRPEHRFYRGDGYFEIDIDVHIFNYLARKGLVGITQHFGNMVVDFGFVMEGQDDDELPENIFACGRLCKVDVKKAKKIHFK